MEKANEQGARILIVDDTPRNVMLLGTILRERGYLINVAENGFLALESVTKVKPDLILLDVMMPVMDGFEACRRFKEDPETRDIPIIFLTARVETKDIVKGFELGAVDYVIQPFRNEELLARVRTHVKLTRTEKALRERLEGLQRTRRMVRIAAGIEDIVALSPGMKDVMEKALLFHNTPGVSVAIEGETGTGKEIVAKLIHFGDGGVDTPFVDINVAALMPDLFESELFGYEAGSFTGALQGGSVGKMSIAGEGALFLDEIGELPLSLQPKLLRILQERMFYRIGGKNKQPFNARVICATNGNLRDMVGRKTFRADLYHRLNVGYLHIPPLRERKEEIGPLSSLFLGRFAKRQGRPVKRLSSEAASYLESYHWPGNVRELENTIENACVLTKGNEIPLSCVLPMRDFGEDMERSNMSVHPTEGAIGTNPTQFQLPDSDFNLEEFNNAIILKTMDKFSGNKTRAAEFLGFSRHALRRRLDKIQKKTEKQ